MRHDETILVFPGGGREIAKFKGEEYALRWQGRSGFARVSVANGYPIVPVGLVGGDDVYRSWTTRDSAYAKFSAALSRRLNGRPDMAMPLLQDRPHTHRAAAADVFAVRRPIDTTTPLGVENEQWVDIVKERTRRHLETILSELLRLREKDPYRGLNPLAWHRAATA